MVKVFRYSRMETGGIGSVLLEVRVLSIYCSHGGSCHLLSFRASTAAIKSFDIEAFFYKILGAYGEV